MTSLGFTKYLQWNLWFQYAINESHMCFVWGGVQSCPPDPRVSISYDGTFQNLDIFIGGILNSV